jgi:hypothetical protein
MEDLAGLSTLKPLRHTVQCGGCKYIGKESTVYKCRRYPPQVTIVLVPIQSPVARHNAMQVAPQAFSDYPTVTLDHPGCGEWAYKGPTE